MKPSLHWILVAALLGFVSTIYAADSGLRVTCEGGDVGAEVWVNDKFRGECPVDLKVPAGPLKLVVRMQVDADREQVFEQAIRMGEDSIKKVEVQLPAPRITAAAQQRADERAAEERAQALPRQAAESAAAAQREAFARQREANTRAEYEAGLANGTIKENFRDCADCPEMVAIPPGSFDMGATHSQHTKPVHRVNISQAFAIGKTEVTQAQWKSIMGNNPSKFSGLFNSCGDNCPVEQVSWDDAQAFIQKLNAKTGKQYRLPSEPEWEYACRAGGKHEYCGGVNLDSAAWHGGNSAEKTHPVASKQANAFGLYDMTGNVWEWVEDWYHDDYNGAPADGSAWVNGGEQKYRVLRGGSWYDNPNYQSSAVRIYQFGFRLARTLP